MFICEPIKDIKVISTEILSHKYLGDTRITLTNKNNFTKLKHF
jgi:hypothetical protein